MAKAKSYKELQLLNYEDFQVPLEIYHEWRQSARVSLSKSKAIVRIPIMVAHSTKEEHLKWAKDWITKKLQKDKSLVSHFNPKPYLNETILEVRGTQFILYISETDGRSSASGRRKTNQIFIQLPSGLTPRIRQQTCVTVIHRIMSQAYIGHIRNRVNELNEKYFRKEINEIRLRNNTTNWGSCSTNKNISISSRLLLAPNFVLDYIIIHELAHLVHHNHSERYWKLVESVLPNYMEAEDWLKKFGSSCNW
ncbi:MAG: M48 family metallopeptidase [Saprospiraceae bacterium]